METWVPDDADVRADLATLGWTIASATATLLGARLWNPLNLDLEALLPRYVLALHVWALVIITLLAVVASVQLSLGSEVARGVVGVLGGVATLFIGLWGLLGVAFYSAEPHDSDEKVLARRGSSELVLVQSWFFDPTYHVELRRGFGPFRQATVVWQGAPEASGPAAARFLGPGEVAVSVPDPRGARVCDYVVPHNELTLEPDRLHPEGFGTEGC
jgi:hypothetical protein